MNTAPVLLDVKAALAAIGGKGKPISRSTFYEGIAAGRFPKPIKIGPKAARWIEHELEDCVRAMIAARG